MSKRVVAAALLSVSIAIGACGAGSSAGPGLSETAPHPVNVRGIAADPTQPAGWVLSQQGSLGVSRIYRLDSEGIEELADLGLVGVSKILATGNGTLAAVAVRCKPSIEACDATVSEVALIGDDGKVGAVTELSSRSGPPDDSDSVRIVGEADGVVWVANFDDRLYGVDMSGRVRHSLPARGDPCVVDGQLQAVVDAAEQLDGVQELAPTPDPNESAVYAVLSGIHMDLAPGGEITASSNSTATCVDGGFVVRDPDSPRAELWSGQHWQTIDFAPDPPNARTAHLRRDDRDEFIVDEVGNLLFRKAGEWIATPIVFDAARGSDQPPPSLVADRSGTTFAACAVVAGAGSWECLVGSSDG